MKKIVNLIKVKQKIILIVTFSIIIISGIGVSTYLLITRNNEEKVIQANNRDKQQKQLEIITKFINIREETNTNSNILGKVYEKEIYTILDKKEENGEIWYHIKTNNNIEGYIYGASDYVKELEVETTIVNNDNNDVTGPNEEEQPTENQENNKPVTIPTTNNSNNKPSTNNNNNNNNNNTTKPSETQKPIDKPTEKPSQNKTEVIDATYTTGCTGNTTFSATNMSTYEDIELCQNDNYKKKMVAKKQCPPGSEKTLDNDEVINCTYNVPEEKIITARRAQELGYLKTVSGNGYTLYYCTTPYTLTYRLGHGLSCDNIDECYCEPEMLVIKKELETCPTGYEDVSFGNGYFVVGDFWLEKDTCYKRAQKKYTCPTGYTLKDNKCYKN